MSDITSRIRATTYSAPEVAKMIGFHRNTVIAMCRRGELEQVVVGSGARGKRITKASVDAYLERLNTTLDSAGGTQRSA